MSASSSSSTVAAAKDVVASIVGSTACVYTGQPFDTIKVRMQVQSGQFKSSIDCMIQTFGKEGLRALWRGSVPALTGALSENAVAFGVNGFLSRLALFGSEKNIGDNKTWLRKIEPFINGGITGAFTAIVLCPCDVVKCRAQLSRAQGLETSVRDIITSALKTQGVRGLYTGFSAQVLRDIPFYSSFFGTYAVSCEYLKTATTWSDTSVYFVSGGLAGQVAWACSIAPDTIKSTIQTSTMPLSILNTYRQIVRQYGIRGLFAGVEVAIIRAFPANAALFVGYEWSRGLMGK